MNAEEIKLVTDMLQSLGQVGTTGFIWWLVMDKLIPAISWLVGVWMFMKYVCLPVAMSLDSYSTLCSLRDRLGVGSPGPLSPSELTRTRKALDTIISNSNWKCPND